MWPRSLFYASPPQRTTCPASHIHTTALGGTITSPPAPPPRCRCRRRRPRARPLPLLLPPARPPAAAAPPEAAAGAARRSGGCRKTAPRCRSWSGTPAPCRARTGRGEGWAVVGVCEVCVKGGLNFLRPLWECFFPGGPVWRKHNMSLHEALPPATAFARHGHPPPTLPPSYSQTLLFPPGHHPNCLPIHACCPRCPRSCCAPCPHACCPRCPGTAHLRT